MKIEFSKYHGTGNDFIIVDDRNAGFPVSVDKISHLCHRRFGVGADGLILLQTHQEYDFRMRYFNADGNESTMCGNGGRCITAFAHSLGIFDKDTVFQAVDGKHESMVKRVNDQDCWSIALKMKDIRNIRIVDKAFVIDSGSPHVVMFVEDLTEMDVVGKGRAIRYSEEFAPDGTNVNFIEKWNGEYHIRTYERGVEDETLSCGTGTVASAVAVSIRHNLSGGIFEFIAPGGKLGVKFSKNRNVFEDVWLEGPAQRVFTGIIEL